MKEDIRAIIIGIIQAIVTVVLTIAMTSNWIVVAVLFAVDIIAFALLYLYYKKKLKEKEDECDEKLKEKDAEHEKKLAERDELLRLYKNIGIDDCTEELKGTPLEPRQCMQSVNKYLDFMGVGGNKWVDQDDKVDMFKTMLKKVKASKGRVRYLLVDPRSEGYRRLKELRQNKVPSASYIQFKKLVKKYDCLEVRLYDDIPSFRLQFVDQEYVAVSRYYIEHELHAKKEFGWKIPHLIIRAERLGDIQKGETEYQGTLYKSFEQLYEYIWAHSKDINELDISILESEE